LLLALLGGLGLSSGCVEICKKCEGWGGGGGGGGGGGSSHRRS